jgi:PHD/YefM family antitoxin component YafN of YafNO toxin-antitoxin module
MGTAIDVSKIPALARLVEEVEATKKPRALKRDDRIVAVLMPAEAKESRKPKADYEALLASAGSWKDVDTERLKADIYADRETNNARPSIKL